MTPETYKRFDAWLNHLFWLLLAGSASSAVYFVSGIDQRLQKMAEEMARQNLGNAVMIERLDNHVYVIRDHEKRIRRLEQ